MVSYAAMAMEVARIVGTYPVGRSRVRCTALDFSVRGVWSPYGKSAALVWSFSPTDLSGGLST